MAILLFIVIHWFLSLFCQTFFHHRYAAHAMFTMNRFWEKVFYWLSMLFQGSSYLSPYAYGVLHRLHHAYADTDKDPHSPKYHPNLFKMMWETKTYYANIFFGRVEIEDKYTRNLPNWVSFDKIADSWGVRIFWVALYTAFYVYFATAWWQYLFLPLHFVMGPTQGAVINYFAHKIGRIRFKVNDTSRNLMPVDIFMLGEGYHNNHHKFPGDPNFGKKWYEFDPIYPIILLFHFLHIIRLTPAKA